MGEAVENPHHELRINRGERGWAPIRRELVPLVGPYVHCGPQQIETRHSNGARHDSSALAGGCRLAAGPPSRAGMAARPTTPRPRSTTAALTDDQVAALCRQLDAPDFAAREQATKRLSAAGRAVIDKVTVAAETDNLEVAVRSLIILKDLGQRPDQPVREAARGRSSGSRAAGFDRPRAAPPSFSIRPILSPFRQPGGCCCGG